MGELLGNFSMSYIIVSSIFGLIATAMFIYGKNIDNMTVRYSGVVMMLIPMAITDTLLLTVVSLGIMFYAYKSMQ